MSTIQTMLPAQSLPSVYWLDEINFTSLLFDEPASGMDVVSPKNIQKMILRLAEFGKTICVVEHNLDLVKELSDESLFMNQGEVIRKAKPEELMTDPQLALVYFGG